MTGCAETAKAGWVKIPSTCHSLIFGYSRKVDISPVCEDAVMSGVAQSGRAAPVRTYG